MAFLWNWVAGNPSSKVFDRPWRKVQWEKKQGDQDFVRNYVPPKKDQKLRIMLHGPPGSGKSSFINSVDSAVRGRIATRALASASFSRSFTTKYRTFKIKKSNPDVFYPFVFNDTMGIEKDSTTGVRVEDIKLTLKGHVKDGYQFNHIKTLQKDNPYYNPSPSLDDRVHVLVCVVPANTLEPAAKETIMKMRAIREMASDLGIPQICILTHIDEACPEVKKNIRNVYRSRYLKKKMEEVSVLLSIPMNCVFLMKNYFEETNTDDDTDALILDVMRKIIDFGEDFLEDAEPTPAQLSESTE